MAYNGSSSTEMEENASSQNGNWPFSVRYTASPYRKTHGGKVPPGTPSPYTHHNNGQVLQGHPHYQLQHNSDPSVNLNVNSQLLLQHQNLHSLKQKHFASPHHHPHLQQNYQNHPHPHPSPHLHHNPNGQNHFLDLKQHQEQQQHLIHYRQRQYDHHNYGLPLNLNMAALPPEVILQASQATLNKTLEMDLQRFENFQNFQNLEALQAQQMQILQHQQQQHKLNGVEMKGENGQGQVRIGPSSGNGENLHFRMRYPPITPRNRVIKMRGNVTNLEQVECLDEGYIEELKLQPHHQQPPEIPPHLQNIHSHPGFPQNFHTNFQQTCPQNLDPYSYVYDGQTQLIKEDLSVCSASVNTFLHLNKKQYQSHKNPSHQHLQQQQNLNPGQNQSHPPEGYFHYRVRSNNEHNKSGDDSHLENEYEEICDVQKYMNINPEDVCPTVAGLGGVEPGIDKEKEIDVKPVDDNLSSDAINGEGDKSSKKSFDQADALQLSAPLQNLEVHGPLPPKHFKSYSTSTDDILAEVVQVRKKHDRVLDQLNLEVENLLIKSSSLDVDLDDNNKEDLCKRNSLLLGEGYGGSYSTLVVTKDAPPFCLNGSLPFRSAAHSSANFGTINAFGTFGRKSKQGRNSVKKNASSESPLCCTTDLKDSSDILEESGNKCCKMNSSFSKMKELKGLESSEDIFSSHGGGGAKVKSKYQRSMSLIPNWKIRDHLMRLPFLRSNSHHQDKVKKSEGLVPHSHSISGGDFPALQANHQPQLLSKKQKGKFQVVNNIMSSTTTISEQAPSANNLKTRASSVDELRSTGEEHWYSADSDTEPDSLIAPLPPAHSPPADQDAIVAFNSANENCVNSKASNGSVNVNTANINLVNSASVNNLNLNQDKVNCLSYIKGQTFPLQQQHAAANIYSNCGDCNGSRMDVVASTLGNGGPDIPKAPKFRRPAIGLKDKWRESWSSHSSNPKSLIKPSSMEEENRLLRWFSLRKNSASASFDGSSNHSNGGTHRHSTLPQLTEEDLKRISFMEDEEGYWPRRTVQPPSLPPPPSDLTGDQLTRRHIVAALVHSENSYVAALQRLVSEYKKPLECSHPAIISHSKISAIFHRVPEILQCHSLFRIALAECVRKWDCEEKIGDVFVASFSKSLVLDVYSEFINNFGTAMETAKAEARRKSAFAEFLKVKQITAHDRLSLFGLMVKPVQRFPQFILLLQDLLKHTPKDHHDRMSLQLALTQLESLAAMLNERKRESEQYLAFRETIKSIGGGKFVLLRSIVDDPNRILLRQDLTTQLEFDNYGSTVGKSKTRKLLLLNDMLICTTVTGSSSFSESSSHPKPFSRRDSTCDNEESSVGRRKSEKNVFKWSYPVRDVEVEDISISPTMSRFVHNKGAKNSAASTPTEESSMSITLLEEMQCLMHDYEVLSRVLSHVATLKSAYEGLTVPSVKDLMLEIQHQIRCRDEQISYFDSSCLTLLLGSGANKEKVVFQMQSPQARSGWVEELRLAQLALDPNNSPAWDIPLESPYPSHKLPLFVKAVPLSKQPHLTVVKCGCFFTHTFVSQTGRSKILDYLWVSSTDGISSHLTAFRSQQNTLKEVTSMDLMEEKVNDMIFVQGYIWVATESRRIKIYDPADTEKGPIAQQILTDAVLKLFFYNNSVFAGLADGHVAIFVQLNFEPENLDKFCPEILLQLGNDRIVSLFGSKEYVYAACGSSIITVNAKTFTVEKNVLINHHNGPISHMTCSGVGLWITTQESETVCLYHLESFQHLQDVSIRPSVYRTVKDSFRRSKGVYVTCLVAHKGWLWIGTNLGVVLTIPLPRLEGVPIISTGNANVSVHGFFGPVTFLMPLMKSSQPPLSLLPSKKSGNSTSVNTKEIKDNQETHKVPLQQISQPEITNKGNTADSPAEKISQDIQDTNPPEPCLTTPLTIEVDVPDKSQSPEKIPEEEDPDQQVQTQTTPPFPNHNGVVLRNKKRKHNNKLCSSNNNSSSSSSSIENSSPSPNSQSQNGSGGNKTLVVLRKKSSKESIVQMRNCKTLPRGGHPSNLRFSIDSDVYGLYGNLINVRGLEDEGRFVDPLYDALRRSDPELNSLDVKISTLDRRLKMRMNRPRSLDLSNWSVDSKISASSDDSSVGLKSTVDFTMHLVHTQSDSSPTPPVSTNNTSEIDSVKLSVDSSSKSVAMSTPTTTGRKGRQKGKTGGNSQQERTALVVVGGRGYLNSRSMTQEHFISTTDSETKSCPHLTLWQMKT